jgi:ring-1,2-phenylacetyl-CoA epoxidase subunit PaaD
MVITEEEILKMLDKVSDPEIPALSIADMGILRGVRLTDDGVLITITPTYSGCPAMYEIRRRIVEELKSNGVEGIKIDTVLSPAWTTDWMSDEAKAKLKESGIAPPKTSTGYEIDNILNNVHSVECPYCNSANTELRAEFSSTACKSLYYCKSCEQPFEHFKCH